jgi:hypothetical protein
MTKTRQNTAIVVGLGLAVWILFFRKAKASAAAPVVPGAVTSGSQSATIDTNVLSDTFGEVISGDVAEGSNTP